MSDLVNLKEAALLIEEMTGCRWKYDRSGPFLYAGTNVCVTINTHREYDPGTNEFQILFEANLLRKNSPMDSVWLARLQEEAGVAHALLSALEMHEYVLTPEELNEFGDFIRDLEEQHEAQEHEQSDGPIMGQRHY